MTSSYEINLLHEKNLTPLEPYPGSVGKPWKMRCNKCDSIISPNLANLKKSKTGCTICRGYKSWNHTSATLILSQNGMKPIEPYPGNTNKKWKMQCLDCDDVCEIVFSNLLKGQGGCRSCGSNPENKNIVYLIHNFKLSLLKVGVASGNGGRVLKHKSLGWHIDRVILIDSSIETNRLEKLVINYLKKSLKSKIGKRELLPQRGYTETGEIVFLPVLRNFFDLNLREIPSVDITQNFVSKRYCEWCLKN